MFGDLLKLESRLSVVYFLEKLLIFVVRKLFLVFDLTFCIYLNEKIQKSFNVRIKMNRLILEQAELQLGGVIHSYTK